MKKIIGFIAVAGLMFAGCEESYNAVNGSDQVLVRDGGDKIDNENIKRACTDKNMHVIRIQWVGNGKTAALVTCEEGR